MQKEDVVTPDYSSETFEVDVLKYGWDGASTILGDKVMRSSWQPPTYDDSLLSSHTGE